MLPRLKAQDADADWKRPPGASRRPNPLSTSWATHSTWRSGPLTSSISFVVRASGRWDLPRSERALARYLRRCCTEARPRVATPGPRGQPVENQTASPRRHTVHARSRPRAGTTVLDWRSLLDSCSLGGSTHVETNRAHQRDQSHDPGSWRPGPTLATGASSDRYPAELSVNDRVDPLGNANLL